MSPPLPGGITKLRIISGITSSPGLTRNLGTGNSPNWCRPNFYNQGRRQKASKTAPRFPILTGVQENAILRNISVHLPMVFIVFHCFRRQATFIAPVTDFLDTCRVGLGVKAIFGEGLFLGAGPSPEIRPSVAIRGTFHGEGIGPEIRPSPKAGWNWFLFPQNPSNCGKKHPQLAGFAGRALALWRAERKLVFRATARKIISGRPRGKAGECK